MVEMTRTARRVTFTPRRWLRKIWQFGNFDVSRDGRLLAFAANKGDQWGVHIRDLRSGRERLLMESDQAVLNPEFSPDGRSVAVQSDFEGDENHNIYVVPAKGGEPRRLTDPPMDHASPRWSPDGRRIAFISNRHRDRENVFVVDAGGGEPRRLTDEEEIVSEIAWRPDGRSIAFSVGTGNLDWVGLAWLEGRVDRLVAFPDSESQIGGEYGGNGKPYPWSPDGQELAFVSNVHDRLDLGVLDLTTAEVRWLVETEWDKTMPIWSPDGKRIAFLENRDGDVRLRTVDRKGRNPRALSPSAGVASRPLWHTDGRAVLFAHSTSNRPERLFLRRGKRTTTLLDSLQGRLPKDEIGGATLVRFPTFDGRDVPGWLYVPPKGRSRRAALVKPHGGPEWQSFNDWSSGVQFLVAQGYTVLLPNYRGGTGYGRAWRRMSDRDLGGADMKDIIAGGQWLVQRKLCPPDRLGILGVSYGGYAVAHCLEQAPDLWAVGVSIVGFFDWITASKNERGFLEKYDRWKMGHPVKDEERFRRMSPIRYLDRIRAPVLFTAGAHDVRCPVTEARQMVDAMKRDGKVVDYLEFPDEGHGPRKMSNQIRLSERTIEWLNTYLPDA